MQHLCGKHHLGKDFQTSVCSVFFSSSVKQYYSSSSSQMLPLEENNPSTINPCVLFPFYNVTIIYRSHTDFPLSRTNLKSSGLKLILPSKDTPIFMYTHMGFSHQTIFQAPQRFSEMMFVTTIVSPWLFLALQIYFPKLMVSMSSMVRTLLEMRAVWPVPLFTSLQEVCVSTGRCSYKMKSTLYGHDTDSSRRDLFIISRLRANQKQPWFFRTSLMLIISIFWKSTQHLKTQFLLYIYFLFCDGDGLAFEPSYVFTWPG